MPYFHQPVMLEEAMTALRPVAGGRYVDGTAGGGGHTRAILERVGPQGRVLALDQDADAIRHLEDTLAGSFPNLVLRRANFSTVDEVMTELGWEAVEGMILDLGLSSHQLESSGRGFSFGQEEPLDMRQDTETELTAFELVNRLREKELADLIFRLGEERGARRVARAVVRFREKKPVETSLELAEIVRRALRSPGRRPRIHPATRTFQALRLAVNRELEHLEIFLAKAPGLIRVGGRLVVIAFHSLEDRLVKEAMARNRAGPNLEQELKAVNKKPLRPSAEELQSNPRARSARLRVGERI